VQRWAFLLLVVAPLAGCATARVVDAVPALPPEPLTETILVLDDGWHTEIALPAASLEEPLARFRGSFPANPWISFSFGERRYELQQTHSALDSLIALLPGPGIVMVIGHIATIATGNETLHATPLKISRAGLDRLQEFIWHDFSIGAYAGVEMLRNAPEFNMRVYASTASYDATYTCNTWTLEGLRAAGLPTSPFGVLFAGQAMVQIQRLEQAQAK
jgi:uncharacterized protein (TIGR02117 family)